MKRKGHLLLSLGLFFLVQVGAICWSQTTERVSVDSAGGEGDGPSFDPSISSDGRYVAFESDSVNLVVGDNNTSRDIFVHDRQAATTTRVSVASGGGEGSGNSSSPSISADGMHVAFESNANDLVVGDTNPFPDVFVHDLLAGTTTLVSVDSTGAQDLGPSSSTSLSSNGRYVAFDSDADLVATDSNGFFDVFVHDRDADEDGTYDEPGAISTVRVSVDSGGNEVNEASIAPSISADGRYVAFSSFATDLVGSDTNGKFDIFVHDRDADGNGTYDEVGGVSTVRVSVDSGGGEGNGDSNSPSISADGRYVAFDSDATDLVGSDTNGKFDIFVHDRDADGNGTYDEVGGVSTVRVSVDSGGGEGNGDSNSSSISADGRYVAFYSEADNLVVNDVNGSADAFVHDLQTGATTLVSVDSTGMQGNGDSNSPSISADGKYVALESDSDNLVANDTNGFLDVFLHVQPGGNESSSSSNSGCFIATAAYESRRVSPPN